MLFNFFNMYFVYWISLGIKQIILFSIYFNFFTNVYFQLKKLDVKIPKKCLDTFKSNNFLGLLILFALIIGKFN